MKRALMTDANCPYVPRFGWYVGWEPGDGENPRWVALQERIALDSMSPVRSPRDGESPELDVWIELDDELCNREAGVR